jgi:4-amino-4-deoxy-L-arabinose transferase-like glycosyltransferase
MKKNAPTNEIDEDRKTIFWFFILAFVILAAGYGLREPWPADEPRFVLVAKQMVESGNYLFPHRGIELYADKPPIFFWILSGCYLLIGSWRWSFLLPSLIAGMGTLYLSFDLARRLWNPRAGLWAATAILFSFQFVYQFKRAQIDPVLVLFTTIAIYGMLRHLLLGPHWRWFYAACFFSGLGVITKGVGFLPLLILLPYLGLRLSKAEHLAILHGGNGFKWLAGIVFFAFAISIWLVPVLWVANHSGLAEHQAYLNNILFKQTAKRYADPWQHLAPWWYFAQVLAFYWLPFSLSFLWLWRPWKNALQQKDARILLPLLWAMMVVIFFSLSSAKRDMYILPALPAFALAAAPFLQGISESKWFRRVLLAFVVLLSSVLVIIGTTALFGVPQFEVKLFNSLDIPSINHLWAAHIARVNHLWGALASREAELLDSRDIAGAYYLWTMLAGVGIIGLISALVFRTRRVLLSCIIVFTMLWIGYGLVLHPVLDDASSSKTIMQQARALAGAKTTIGLVDWKEQNLLQAEGPVTEFGFLKQPSEQLWLARQWLQQSPEQRVLLVQATEALKCLNYNDPSATRLGIANRRTWWLIKSDTALTACTSAEGIDDGRQ